MFLYYPSRNQTPELKNLELPEAPTLPPDHDDTESVRRESNRTLDLTAKRIGLLPQKLRRLIEIGRMDLVLALANESEIAESHLASANIGITGPEPWPEPVRVNDVLARMTHA